MAGAYQHQALPPDAGSADFGPLLQVKGASFLNQRPSCTEDPQDMGSSHINERVARRHGRSFSPEIQKYQWEVSEGLECRRP